MEWLQNLLAGESGMAVQLVLITLGLVILLILVFWLFRKITGAAAPKSSRNRVPRLSVTDSTRVDENRYLVLVRRDNVEHLVMIGGPSDVVVETNIVRTQTNLQSAPVKSRVQPAPSPAKEISNEVPAVEDRPSPVAASAIAAGAAAATVMAAEEVASKDEDTVKPDGDSDPVAPTAEALPEPSVTHVDDKPEQEPEQMSDAAQAELEPVMEELEISFDDLEEEITAAAEETGSAEPAPAVENAEPEPVVELPESDLEASISEQLDDVLSSETLGLDSSDSSQTDAADVSESTAQETAEIELDESDKQDSAEDKDDMQRLLDELAGVKETA